MTPPRGRFRIPLDDEALAFSSSLDVDRRLYREDIDGSIAHVTMLAQEKIIPGAAARKIRTALLQIRREIEGGRLQFPGSGGTRGRMAADDIHMAIEARLVEKVGEIGKMLHTARSRNDQVALDERLYLRREMARIQLLLRSLQKVLVRSAHAHRKIIMPGYTHLQRAQPILLAHHLLAYVEMFERDRGRFADGARRGARSPLGAAALAGTPFPIKRSTPARLLKLDGVVENSIDAVSDRDALLECVSACALTMMHLSRMAEELVLWTSQEWHFAAIGEAFTTGSSIMPQKQNPDMAELVRGKTGRVYGDLVALLTVMKGLPLAYNRDMQEDKEPLFDAVDTTAASLSIMARMMKTVRFAPSRFDDELRSDFLLATELADYLVRKGVAFRTAYTAAGAAVRECAERGCALADLPLRRYRALSRAFDADVYAVLDPRASVRRKKSAGSTSPAEVSRALRRWQRCLGL
jgi:argininosuccinate lyase